MSRYKRKTQLDRSCMKTLRCVQFREYFVTNMSTVLTEYLTETYIRSLATVSTHNRSARPIPVAARSKAWVCGGLLAGIAGSYLTGGMDVFLF
jgi:ABC-type uncharacterized transport system permease subunit